MIEKYQYSTLVKMGKNMVEYLVELGVDINKESKYGETPIFKVYESRNGILVNYLLEYGANIKYKCKIYEKMVKHYCIRHVRKNMMI